MIRAWIAVALLAGSWMFGLDYFYPANPWIWAALVTGATLLLGGSFKRSACRSGLGDRNCAIDSGFDFCALAGKDHTAVDWIGISGTLITQPSP